MDENVRLAGLPRRRSTQFHVADVAIAYLRRLAVAAARDRDFMSSTPRKARQARLGNKTGGRIRTLVDTSLLVPHPAEGMGKGRRSLATNGSEKGGEDLNACDWGNCLLCGNAAVTGDEESTACGCSEGHAVCGACLHQYVLHTHGLKVRARWGHLTRVFEQLEPLWPEEEPQEGCCLLNLLADAHTGCP